MSVVTPAAARTYRRFAPSQRLEHVALVASFTVLALTGLPQKFAGAPISENLIALLGGIDQVRQIHRFAATLLMLGSIFHLVAVTHKVIVRRVRLTMLPGLKDAIDAFETLKYNLGFARHRPQMGRYTFEEKVEYWSLVWGTVVMIITGFMLWNPIATTQLLPGEFIPAAKAAHGGEAVLAVLAIILWHMWSVHVRHFNRSMWTGNLTEAEMLHEHPLELADIKAGVAERRVAPHWTMRARRLFTPVASLVSVGLLAGVFLFVTFEKTAIDTLPEVERPEVYVPLPPTPLPPTPTPPPVGALSWNGYVSGLLAEKCSMCHGQAGGLDMSTYASVLAGGRSGPAVVPGEPGQSVLVQVQSAGSHPRQLSPEDLERLIAWIESGAPEE